MLFDTLTCKSQDRHSRWKSGVDKDLEYGVRCCDNVNINEKRHTYCMLRCIYSFCISLAIAWSPMPDGA